VGAQNPWVRRRKIELAELVNEPWVLPPPETTIGLVAREAFRDSGLDHPRTTVISEPAEVRISLLATGRYISIFPDSALRFSSKRAELKVLPVTRSLGRVPVGVITLKNRTISPIARLFIDTCCEVAKQLATNRKR
jgi:DNA-binding transcriptional LysR family regulator